MKHPPTHPFRSERARDEYQALYAERAKAWPVSGEERLVETPSGQTFVRISGDPGSPPLVLLPGARGTSLTWIPNISALSARYRTFALDTINDIGLSVRHKPMSSAEEMRVWLAEVLALLVPEGRFSLVGLSNGGWLASQYALHYPERLRKLVLLAPSMTVLTVSPGLILRGLLTQLPLPGMRRQLYYWLLQDSVRSGAAGKASVDEAVADWATAERCFSPLPLVMATVMSDQELQNFRVPCLVLVGEHEKIYPPGKVMQRLARLAPQIQAEIIPGAGHDLWVVQAGLVTQKILDFLEQA